MTAGLRNQPVARAKVALAPAAIVGLLGAALLVGGTLGVVAKAQFDSITTDHAIAQVATSAAESRSLIGRQAQIVVGRGPLVGDAGTAARQPMVATHAVDHIGLIERLFPVSTPHRIQHGPLP